MVLTLYKIDGSPPVKAVKMTIEALGIRDVQYVNVNLLEGEHLTEEYLKMNPQHTVPMLKDEDYVIWESHSIAAYLVTKYGEDDSLYPTDPQKRAVVDQRLHFDTGILFPALKGTIEPIFIRGEKSPRPEDLEKIKKAYEFTDKFLSSDWLAGDKVTIADICCGSTISTMNEILPIDGALYPNLAAWNDRCAQQEFFKKCNLPDILMFRELYRSKLG